MMATTFVDHEAEESGPDDDLLFDEEGDVEIENADMDEFIDDVGDTVGEEDAEDMHAMMDVENAMVLAQKDREEAERIQQRFSSQMSQASASPSSPTPVPIAPTTRQPAPPRLAPKEVTASYKPIGPQASLCVIYCFYSVGTCSLFQFSAGCFYAG